jgi:hypothetical protein
MKKESVVPAENTLMEREIEALDFVTQKWKCRYAYTGKDMFSRVDGFFLRDNELKGIFEVKCRNQGLSWFVDYKSTMISYAKIQIGSDLSRLMRCKFFVLIQTGDKHVIVFQITDEEGRIVCPMNIRYTNSEKNSNFDKKPTTNAYLSLEDNKYCTIHKKEFI